MGTDGQAQDGFAESGVPDQEPEMEMVLKTFVTAVRVPLAPERQPPTTLT